MTLCLLTQPHVWAKKSKRKIVDMILRVAAVTRSVRLQSTKKLANSVFLQFFTYRYLRVKMSVGVRMSVYNFIKILSSQWCWFSSQSVFVNLQYFSHNSTFPNAFYYALILRNISICIFCA